MRYTQRPIVAYTFQVTDFDRTFIGNGLFQQPPLFTTIIITPAPQSAQGIVTVSRQDPMLLFVCFLRFVEHVTHFIQMRQ
jgi:hypothetical protein